MKKKEEPKEKAPAKVGMSAFNVTTMSNKGVQLPLTLPDGTPTADFMVIRGGDSTAFKNRQAMSNREIAKAMKGKDLSPVQIAKIKEGNTRHLLASLVSDWSFDEECNEINIVKFFSDAPQIMDQIDLFANDRSNFFVKPPQD